MKRIFIILIIITALVLGLVWVGIRISEQRANPFGELQTESITLGSLSTAVEADGIVQSNQSATLFWKVSGEVESVLFGLGDRVAEGDILASLNEETLPAHVIAARGELVSTHRALNDLLESKTQKAQALKDLDAAREALDDANHPETAQAQALVAVAEAKEAVEVARRAYEIISKPTSQAAVDQAYANLLLAENKVSETEDFLERLANQDIRATKYLGLLPRWMVMDIRHDIRRTVKQVEILLVQEKLAYENSLSRYNALLSPPNPLDVAAAEAELATAEARLSEALREWEKVKDGFSAADISVLEAELEKARREWERVKDGPHPDDITVLETQITAAEAILSQVNITAPFNGTVTSVKTQVHDVVEPGTLAFRIDDLSHLYVSLGISEIDIDRVNIGQIAVLTFDSLPLQEYQGVVREIAFVGTKVLGATTFKVLVEVLDADQDIRPGMTSSVKIMLEENETALLVPSQAIRSLDGEIVVYRLLAVPARSRFLAPSWEPGSSTGGRFTFPVVFRERTQQQIEMVAITLGNTSSGYSEILAGDIEAGDLVVLNPPGE